MYNLVVRALIEVNGKLLLVKHSTDSDFWVLPGGRVDQGEDIKDALRRELIEELGIEPDIGKLLYVHQLRREETERVEFFFHIQNGSEYKTVKLGDGFHSTAELEQLGFYRPDEVNLLPPFIAKDYAELLASNFNREISFKS